MAAETPSDRILTIPNAVSFLRLIGVGVFWWVLLVLEEPVVSGWLIFGVGWTDWVDGYLARKLGQVSKLGKALDPVADRLMIASAVVGGLLTGILPPIIGWGLIVRELFMLALALWLLRKGGGQLEVRWIGKVATFGLYGAIPTFYLAQGETLTDLLTFVGWFSAAIGLALYWLSALLYAGDARRRVADLELETDPEEV